MRILPPSGPERNRQLTRLGMLLVVLAGVLWYWSGTTTVPPTPASNQANNAGRSDPGQLPVPESVQLGSLRPSAELAEAGRNPFVFGQREAASPPGSAFLTTPQTGPPPGVVPSAPPVPQGPPPIPLRLAGMTVATSGGRTLVTLKDPSSDALYQAFEGDIVDGRYRVVKVGVQSVVVSYLDGSGIRTLPLGG
jgi:hypothetical protein